jgi:uncharacterized membrane protein
MSDVPVQLIVAAFQDEKGAESALSELKVAKFAGLIGIQDAAVMRRDQKDKIHIKDVRDVGARGGTVFGALVGTGIALATGGAGIILSGAVGALVGRMAAKKIDMGLDNKRLKEIADALKPGTSAIIAIIEHKWVAEIENAFAEAGANVIKEALKADIAAQLEAGKEVGYSVLVDEESTELERIAGDENEVELGSLQISEDVISAQATFATEDGLVTRGLTVSDGGLVFSELGLAMIEDDQESESEEQS